MTEQKQSGLRQLRGTMRLTLLFPLFSAALFAQSPISFESHLTAGQTAMQQSHYTEADTQFRAALADAARPDPARSPARVVEAYSWLCDLDLMLGRYDEAISLAGKAVESAEALEGNPDLSPHLARLAGAYRAGGKTNLAVPVLQRMLDLDKKTEEDDPRVAVDYEKLGSAYMEIGVIPEARKAYRSALETRINRLGPDHLDVATAWVNLGILEERNSQPQVAQLDFETALKISEKNLGTESYGLTGILDRLGRLFSAQQRFSDSEPQFQRSLAIREKMLGARHSDVAEALDNLGTVYYYDEKYAEAEPLFQRELQIWTATQDPNSPFIAQALENLGALYSAEKRYPEAEPFFRRALSIREAKDIFSLSDLARLYVATNDLKKADDYYQRAILIADKGLGSDHPEVVSVLDEYAKMLRAANRPLDAKKVEARLKEVKDRLNPQVNAGAVGATGAMPATGKK